jgi:AbiV family abortive infection protein
MADQILKLKTERFLARLSSGQNPKRPVSMRETAQGLTACYLNALALLDDARLLAANRREPRALSLTILALEELAKVVDLYDHYVNPATKDNTNAWTEFWKRWGRHKPKQERIAAYGKFLRESKRPKETVSDHSSPYRCYLNENAYCHLDSVKQRNFYVDFVDARFRRPEASEETSTVLDFLFAFAEERADSFGSWHVTAQRSLDFLSLHKLDDIGLNDWASTHEAIEVAADLLRLLCYHSPRIIPDYGGFYPAFEAVLAKKATAERRTLLRRVLSSITRRMDVEALKASGLRAFLMRKLLLGYSINHLSDTECEELFPGVSE